MRLRRIFDFFEISRQDAKGDKKSKGSDKHVAFTLGFLGALGVLAANIF